jgi:NADH-ubiquinone oxidoreductase chain 4
LFLSLLVLIPFFGLFIILLYDSYNLNENTKVIKIIALSVTIINLIISLVIWLLFNNSSKHFQFVQEQHEIGYYDFYLGIDGLSMYFVLLTTLIMPIAIISNWKSINEKIKYFLVIILLLETLLLLIFMVLDVLMFYIFFESILAPLFILIGLFGSSAKIRASFYFFLYTFLGSLFMLLSIITMQSLIGCTDMGVLYKTNFLYITQVFMFIGIFIAFAVKTPTIYLNSWLLKAHVESPLSGSIILAAIVLKLSLYGIFRLILPILPKAFVYYTYIVFLIGILTIVYASLSTLRTVDIKELIAYSSVSHAAVYLAGVFSNTLHGILGGISLGLAHGFVSSGLFISAGGVLYDRSGTRLISYYKGLTQVMPILSILFFILSLGNCGAPLTLNFVGEFLSLYGVFERLPLAGVLASSSIVFSASYTIYMFNRIFFAGPFSVNSWLDYIPDLNKREFFILFILVIFTVTLGLYPSIILDGLSYYISYLLYNIYTVNCDAPQSLSGFFQDYPAVNMKSFY